MKGAVAALVTIRSASNNNISTMPYLYTYNVESLRATNNHLTDISGLSGLSNMQTLMLGGNQISNLTPLSGLAGLSYVDLSANHVTTVTPLAGLSKLFYLDLDGNKTITTAQIKSQDDGDCIAIPDRKTSHFITLTLPANLHEGRRRIRIDFCQRPFGQMPLKTVSNEIELVGPTR